MYRNLEEAAITLQQEIAKMTKLLAVHDFSPAGIPYMISLLVKLNIELSRLG